MAAERRGTALYDGPDHSAMLSRQRTELSSMRWMFSTTRRIRPAERSLANTVLARRESSAAFPPGAVHTSATAVSQNVFSVSGHDAPAAVSVDLTADTALSFTGDWSASSASNTITGMIYNIESLN